MKKLILVTFLFASLAAAQGTDALLTGNVLDTSGSSVGDAKITALAIDTGVTTSAMSNSAGAYTFVSLRPGDYRITAEKPGFKKFILDKLTLRVGDKVEENLHLEVGALTEAVQVTADADGVQYLTPTLGGVINQERIMDLPVPDRNAINFVLTQGGLVSTSNGVNMNGARTDMLNVTLDGMNIMDQAVNESLTNQNIVLSIDRIQEIKVVTSPADSEFSGGSGQIQLISRSGTNQFHGAAYDYIHNSALNANTWANNRAGTARTVLNQNNPGIRLDGPLQKNKTFFFGLFEATIQRQKANTTATVFTDTARQGIFRYYQGVQNAVYTANVPTSDRAGNPVSPNGSALQSISVFGLDANRTGPDKSGIIAKNLALMPLPNIFNTGDGLNTAGYFWTRVSSNDTYSNTGRLDHNFSDKQRFSISYSRDYENFPNGSDAQPYPTSVAGAFQDWANVGSAALISTISPTKINEARIGVNRATFLFAAPWTTASEGKGILPSINGTPYLLALSGPTSLYGTGTGEDPQGRISPVYMFSDKFTWLHGRHAMKAGFEVDFGSENAFVSFNVVPRVSIGTGNAALSPAFNTQFGNNASGATSLLNTLAGSVGSSVQNYYSPGGANPQFVAGSDFQHTWRHRDFGLYFQDDIKVRNNLTINLGVRWNYFGVPYEAGGRLETAVGGAGSAFGVSGNTFGALFNPGTQNLNNLTQLQLVGRNSPNPGIQPWNPIYKNFAPSIGLSWALPWLGANKTVFRMGYGIAYEKSQTVLLDDLYGFGIQGLSQQQSVTPNVYTNLSSANLFPPSPAQSTPPIAPLVASPLYDNVNNGQTFLVANNGLKQPYIQNYNASLGRDLGHGLTLDVRYVGSKGTKLLRGTNINEINTVENGLLQAFQTTLAGGNSPLLDKIFNGLNVPTVGVVNGTTITGSQAVRTNSTLYAFLLSNSPGGLATTIANQTFITGTRGGLIKNGGLPANFVVANPQFGAVDYISNFSNSTYNSLQVEVNKRFSAGLQLQATYVRSKTLGDYDGNQQSQVTSFNTLRNEHLSKQLLSFDVPNVWRTSAIFDLPFGPNKKFLGGTHGVLAHIVERWQSAVIFNKLSGSPTNFSGTGQTFNGLTATPTFNGPIPTGDVHFSGNNVLYFPSGYTQVKDPSVQNLPNSNLQNLSTLLAIQGPNGQIAVQNTPVGTPLGSNPTMFHGLGSYTFNLTLSKTIVLRENLRITLRADALNILNKPIWSSPSFNINSTSFGQITSTVNGTNRNVVLGGRIDF